MHEAGLARICGPSAPAHQSPACLRPYGRVRALAVAGWRGVRTNTAPSAPLRRDCAARGVELLRWLHRRPEQHIAVVSHWVFLLHLFRPFTQHPELQSRFGNAEARVTTLHRRTAEHDEL